MTSDDDRRARLAAELRANLHRRKAQARATAALPINPEDAGDPLPVLPTGQPVK